MNLKASNLMSRVNKLRFSVRHELSECKCGLNESVYNSKQKWNHNECRCECKEFNDWNSCKEVYL